mgnify:CR=1 FL=1
MTEHTTDEFRGKNKYGHRSKSDLSRKRVGTPKRKNLGNSRKVSCSFCYPKISNRLQKKNK